MKKRLISLALVACLMLTALMFASCANAKKLVTKAMEKTEKLNDFAAVMKIELEMKSDTLTVSVPVTIDMKVKGAHSENPEVSANTSTTMYGSTIESEMYLKDNMIYMVAAENMKYKLSAESVEGSYDYAGDVDEMLQEIPEELLKDVKTTDNDDGSQTVTVTIPNEIFAEMYDDLIDDINSITENMNTVGTGAKLDDIAISKAVVSITIADGYVMVYDIGFEMTMKIQGIAMTTTAHASLTFKDPGKSVTITPPAGYEDFEELGI